MITEKKEEVMKKMQELHALARGNIFKALSEVAYLQYSLNVDLGLRVDYGDYYAPDRFYFSSSMGEVNIHPYVGFKRLNGHRIDGNLPAILQCMQGTEEYLTKVRQQVKNIAVQDVKWEELPLLCKLRGLRVETKRRY